MRNDQITLSDVEYPAEPRRRNAVVEMGLKRAVGLPHVELSALFTMIDRVDADNSPVLQFLSVHRDDGAAQVALDMAWNAAERLGKRILLVDGTAASDPGLLPLPAVPVHSLLDAALGLVPSDDAMIRIAGTELIVATLRGGRVQGDPLGAVDALISLIKQLRQQFAMTVIVPPPCATDGLGVSLARLVHGNVIVVRSERTRASHAEHLLHVLSLSEARILGSVLYRSRSIVPWPFRRWLGDIA